MKKSVLHKNFHNDEVQTESSKNLYSICWTNDKLHTVHVAPLSTA